MPASSPAGRVLITGATGFIGRRLVPQLLAAGYSVSLLVRETYGMGQPLPPDLQKRRDQLQLVFADLRNNRLTRRAVAAAAPDRVIHLAAAGATDPFLSIDTALRHNLHGTLHLLRACFDSPTPARQLIIARTPGEKTHMNVYAASKAAAWSFCQMFARTQAWPVQGAMIFQAFGPGQPARALIPAAAQAARAGQNFPMTSGTQKRDFIYVDDVAAGFARALTRDLPPGITFDLGTGRCTSLLDAVQTIYDLAGQGGAPQPGRLPDRPGETATQTADVAGLQRYLDWLPPTSLHEGLRLTYELGAAS